MDVVKAGRLNKKITIQETTQTQNSYGEVIDAWSTYAFIWASVEPTSGREFMAAQQINSEITIAFRTRYLSGVTAKMRISWDGRLFDIESVINPVEKNEQLLIICRERL